MSLKSTKLEPENLFCTKHVLSILGLCYLTVLSPAIDKYAENKLTKEDIVKTINALVYSTFAASLKLLDKNVYTNKKVFGRDKDQALDNINNMIINTVTNTTKDIVNTTITTTTNDISKQTLNTILPNTNQDALINTLSSNIISNPIEDINTNIDKISNLFRTRDSIDKEQILPIVTTTTINTVTSSTNTNPLTINNAITNISLTNNKLTYYKKELADSSTLSDDKKIIVEPNTKIYIDSYVIDTISNHISFVINNSTLFAYIPDITIIENNKEVELVVKLIKPINNNFRPTIEQCNELYHTVLTADEYKDLINCLDTFGINTKIDVAHLLSQIGHESAGLRYNKEIASGEDYEYREDLGNIYEGDGVKYKGSGFIQLTGRANFTSFSQYINDPKVIELGCDYVAEVYPFSSAGWFWNHNELSSYINDEGATIEQVSTAVNGGNPANGLEDRQFYFSRCKEIFNIA